MAADGLLQFSIEVQPLCHFRASSQHIVGTTLEGAEVSKLKTCVGHKIEAVHASESRLEATCESEFAALTDGSVEPAATQMSIRVSDSATSRNSKAADRLRTGLSNRLIRSLAEDENPSGNLSGCCAAFAAFSSVSLHANGC